MVRQFRVVTDSTADVLPAWRERYGIEGAPLTVLFGSEAFRDRVDLNEEEFFERLGRASKLPTTSAPAPGDFAAVYRRLSKEWEGFPLHVIDSRSVAMCVGFLCQVAAEAPSLEEAVKRVEERVPRQRILALLDTLRYLEMGGRITRAPGMIGTVLGVT